MSNIGIMNDQLGGTATDLNGENIRYYRVNENVNNHIYFKCFNNFNRSSSTCEVW